jgi:ElaB/YqjD/DUF883 family membrane-anchored ribosome-binding protein
MNNLSQYLLSIRAELQELYEDVDSELRNEENKTLYDDAYHNVISKLEDALTEMDTLVNDLDSGIYNNEHNLDIDDDIEG